MQLILSFHSRMLYNVSPNIELVNTKPLLLGEMQG